MIIKKSEFVCSSPELRLCPTSDFPEFAFIGRSNVGKSSMLNMLTDRKGLAKISGKPGKTRMINHFVINDSWYMVDLPGYGFAKASKKDIEKWGKMIRYYIGNRDNLATLFLLVDSRLEPQKLDVEFMEWLAESQIPFVLLFTKTDKMGTTNLQKSIAAYKRKLLETWEEMPPYILTSAETKIGKEEILNYIEKVYNLFTK